MHLFHRGFRRFTITFVLLFVSPLAGFAQQVPPPEALRPDETGFMLPVQAARRLGSAAFRTPNGRGWTAVTPDGTVSFEINNDPARWVVGRETKTGKIIWRNRDFDHHTSLTQPRVAEGKLRLVERTNYQCRFVWLETKTGKILQRSEFFPLPKHQYAELAVTVGPSDRWLIALQHVPVNTVGIEETETHAYLVDRDGKRKPLELGHALNDPSASFIDEKTLRAPATIDGKVVERLWDIETGKVLPQPPPARSFNSRPEPSFDPPGEATILHFSPDGKLHALFAGRVVVYDPATGKELARGEPLPAKGACCFAADGTTLAVIHGHPRSVHMESAEVFVCEALTGRTLAKIKLPAKSILGFALTADGKRLVTLTQEKLDAPARATEWDAKTGKQLATWEDKNGGGFPPFHSSTSPDGKTRVYRDEKFHSSGVRQIMVWDTTAKGGIRNVCGGYSQSVVFTDNGRQLVTLLGEGVAVWDTLRSLSTEFKSADKAFQNRLAVTPDGTLAITASNDSRLRVYNLKTGAVKQLVGHEGWIDAIAVSPDGKWLVSSSPEAPIYVWPLR